MEERRMRHEEVKAVREILAKVEALEEKYALVEAKLDRIETLVTKLSAAPGGKKG